MAEKDYNSILMALAADQSKSWNSSPFSKAIDQAIKKTGSSVASALMAPGNAMRGDYNGVEVNADGSVNPFNSPLMDAASNMAGVVSLGSAPIPRPMGSLGMGGANLERWFGKGQVANPDGSPMTVYHGTGSDIPAFDRNNPRMRSGKLGQGIYMTPDPKKASFFAEIRSKDGSPNVMPLYTNLRKPFVIEGESRLPVTGIDRARLEAAGYDGVILKTEDGRTIKEVVAFQPTQIKSSIGNNGNFDPMDPNIVRMSGIPIVPSDSER